MGQAAGFDGDGWELTWVVVGERGRVLHAVRELADPAEFAADAGGDGVTSCGRSGWLSVPGLFTRMAASRCGRCCSASAMPPGVGSPKNDDECRKLLGLAVSPDD